MCDATALAQQLFTVQCRGPSTLITDLAQLRSLPHQWALQPINKHTPAVAEVFSSSSPRHRPPFSSPSPSSPPFICVLASAHANVSAHTCINKGCGDELVHVTSIFMSRRGSRHTGVGFTGACWNPALLQLHFTALHPCHSHRWKYKTDQPPRADQLLRKPHNFSTCISKAP